MTPLSLFLCVCVCARMHARACSCVRARELSLSVFLSRSLSHPSPRTTGTLLGYIPAASVLVNKSNTYTRIEHSRSVHGCAYACMRAQRGGGFAGMVANHHVLSS